jgi:hypothetical protein
MSFSTCSCVLWQKEQRSGSSLPIFLTGVLASGRSSGSRRFLSLF